MYKGSLQNFFLAKTTHRIPKLITLALSCSVLVALVTIDASASAFGGRDSNAVRTDVVLTLASESSNSQFSGLVKRWTTVSTVVPTTTTTVTSTTTAPAGGGGTGGGGTGGGGGGGSSTTTTTTTTPPTTTTTTTTPSSPSSSGGLITAGASRSECLEGNSPDTGLAAIEQTVSAWDQLTNS